MVFVRPIAGKKLLGSAGRHSVVTDRKAANGFTDVPAAAPAVSYRPVARREDMCIHRDGVFAALDGADTVILDARPPEEYSGKRGGVPVEC